MYGTRSRKHNISNGESSSVIISQTPVVSHTQPAVAGELTPMAGTPPVALPGLPSAIMPAQIGIGYDPTSFENNHYMNKIAFHGDSAKFIDFKIKLEDLLFTRGWSDVITGDAPDPTKDRLVFSFFVKVLSGEPLQLINREARQSGKRAWDLL